MSKSSGCFGCLGSLLFFTLVGSILFGAVRCSSTFTLGGTNFGFSIGNNQKENAVDSTELEYKRKAVEDAIEVFHTQLNQGKCQDIYEQANEVFKQNLSQSDLVSMCEKLRGRLGTVKSSQLVTWQWNPANQSSDVYIQIQYNTNFSNLSAQETFIWLVRGRKPELYLYQMMPIDSGKNATI